MQMDTKQKALLFLTIAAFGYLGYQVYGLMKSDINSTPSSVQAAVNNGPMSVANAAEPPRPLLKRQLKSPSVAQTVKEEPTYSNAAPLASGQKAYLHMVNQYELAKMQRRLLEEKAAIAAAQHRIATLNKKTHEIDDSLAGTPETYNDTEERHTTPFLLSYVDRQEGTWSATLNRQGHYYQVHIGSVLSDGSKIVGINRRGVTLKKGNKEERVTFNGIVNVTAKKTVDANAITSQARQTLAEATRRQPGKTSQHIDKKASSKQKKVVQAEKTLLAQKKNRDIVLASAKKPIKPVQRQSVTPNAKKKLKKTTLATHPKQIPTTPVHYTEDERRILAMPKNTYAIQLIGSYHRDIVENFAIANDLGDRAMQFYVINRGKRWYILLYGNYPTRAAAQKALNNLPPNLTPENPWVRAIASVQSAIQRSRHRQLVVRA